MSTGYRNALRNGAAGVAMGALAATLLPSSARAQNIPAPADHASGQPDQAAAAVPASQASAPEADGNEILVTARRRAERLQDVPVSVTAFNGSDLQTRNITDPLSLGHYSPGLQISSGYSGSSAPIFSIRSQAQISPDATRDGPVAVYFADVVEARPAGVNSGFYDIASVQVLKGPQGTLFGRNSTGGAILITPNTPVDHFDAFARIGLGNYSRREFEAMINVPVADGFAIRAAGVIARRDGFATNLFNGNDLSNQHTDSWRISARFAPAGSAFSNTLIVDGFRAHEAQTAMRLTNIYTAGAPFGTLPVAFQVPVANYLATRNDDPFQVSNDAPEYKRVRTLTISNTTQLDLGSVTVKNIIGYRTVNADTPIDLDGSPFPLYYSRTLTDFRQVSDEFQVSGNTLGNHLNYIAGLYYFDESGVGSQISATFGGTPTIFRGNIDNESYSGFAQATLHIPGFERVSLTAGVRQTWDNRSLLESTFNQTTGACSLRTAAGVAPNPCIGTGEARFNKPTYTLGADWKVTDDVMLYFTTRSGYRSGGINQRATNLVALALPFAPETLTDYEVGAKTRWSLGQMRGTFNIAAFTSDYRDIQKSQSSLVNGVYLAIVKNAARATIRGVEAELHVNLTPHFFIGATYSYNDAHYNEWLIPAAPPSTVVLDWTGTPFSFSSKNVVSAEAGWTLPLPASVGEVTLFGNYSYRSSWFLNDTQYDPVSRQPLTPGRLPASDTFNIRLDWNNLLSSHFSASVAVNNVANARNENFLFYSASLGFRAASYENPRTLNFDLRYRF